MNKKIISFGIVSLFLVMAVSVVPSISSVTVSKEENNEQLVEMNAGSILKVKTNEKTGNFYFKIWYVQVTLESKDGNYYKSVNTGMSNTHTFLNVPSGKYNLRATKNTWKDYDNEITIPYNGPVKLINMVADQNDPSYSRSRPSFILNYFLSILESLTIQLT